MPRSWWPFRRRSDTSQQPSSPGDKGRDKRLDETRRIVRHLKKKALLPKQEPEPEPAPIPQQEQGVTITNYGSIVHVNFHQHRRVLEGTFIKKDPITKHTRRIARRFDRSDVFYTEDGDLLGDDNWIG